MRKIHLEAYTFRERFRGEGGFLENVSTRVESQIILAAKYLGEFCAALNFGTNWLIYSQNLFPHRANMAPLKDIDVFSTQNTTQTPFTISNSNLTIASQPNNNGPEFIDAAARSDLGLRPQPAH